MNKIWNVSVMDDARRDCACIDRVEYELLDKVVGTVQDKALKMWVWVTTTRSSYLLNAVLCLCR